MKFGGLGNDELHQYGSLFAAWNMIELFKIIKGIYDPTCVSHINFMELSENLIKTRGNNKKLIQHYCHHNLRKFNFPSQVILIWNSLSHHVVTVDNINTFKDRLEQFWANNYKSD